MRCTGCGTDNREGLKFCNECGEPFNCRCAKCGFDNAPAAKFCGDCGSALTDATAAATRSPQATSNAPEIRVTPEQPEASTTLDGERKTVTALFADIKGSTELMEDLDPEDARAIVDLALKLMIEAVHTQDQAGVRRAKTDKKSNFLRYKSSAS